MVPLARGSDRQSHQTLVSRHNLWAQQYTNQSWSSVVDVLLDCSCAISHDPPRSIPQCRHCVRLAHEQGAGASRTSMRPCPSAFAGGPQVWLCAVTFQHLSLAKGVGTGRTRKSLALRAAAAGGQRGGAGRGNVRGRRLGSVALRPPPTGGGGRELWVRFKTAGQGPPKMTPSPARRTSECRTPGGHHGPSPWPPGHLCRGPGGLQIRPLWSTAVTVACPQAVADHRAEVPAPLPPQKK